MEALSTSNPSDHSEEVQEIIGQSPRWIVRWGLTFFATVLIVLATGAYLFKYPVIVSAPITLTTINPPTALVARTNGRIARWYFKDKAVVKKDQVVAVIESKSSLGDVKRLQTFLSALSGEWDHDVKELSPPDSLQLGSLNSAYSLFRKVFSDFKHYQDADLLAGKVLLTEAKIKNQSAHIVIGRKQRNLKSQEFELAKEKFKLDSISYVRGYGMTKQDYHQAVQNFLSQKSSVLAMEISLKNEDMVLLELKESITELSLARESEMKSFRQQLDEAKIVLDNEINSWFANYAFVSPIDGRLTLTNFWSENQTIGVGDRLATVVPEDETIIIARTYIPASALGRVATGQHVNIKLSGFPYLQYGILKGTIKSISMVPEKEGYVAEISLDKGMTSTYRENLKFTHQMDGVADIVTNDSRLIYRFISFRIPGDR